MRVNRKIYVRVDLLVGTRDELKGHCACHAEKEKLNRYSDEQVHLWTCRTV